MRLLNLQGSHETTSYLCTLDMLIPCFQTDQQVLQQ